MSDVVYDFTDVKVWMMVDRHGPTQVFSSEGRPLGSPVCDVCHAAWPCPPIRALRAYEAAAYAGRTTGRSNPYIFEPEG